MDAALLRRMKPTAYLINTARGDLVDNEALRQALLEGRIAGAGLDTLSPEPVPAGHPLTALPPEVQRKVVLAPHLGGITEASATSCASTATSRRRPGLGGVPPCCGG